MEPQDSLHVLVEQMLDGSKVEEKRALLAIKEEQFNAKRARFYINELTSWRGERLAAKYEKALRDYAARPAGFEAVRFMRALDNARNAYQAFIDGVTTRAALLRR